MLGRKITFFCMAQGLPRPEITWFKDGIELYAHKFFQVSWLFVGIVHNLISLIIRCMNGQLETTRLKAKWKSILQLKRMQVITNVRPITNIRLI